MDKPALLLVHGYPFDHSLWDKVVPLVPKDIEVLAPDLRGFGGQPTGTDEPSLDCMADDLQKLMDEQRIPRAVVAGMSMGGYVALAFAERHPERLAGLGLISSQAAADSEESRASRRAMIQNVRQTGPSAAAQAVIPKLFSPQNSQREDLLRIPTVSAEKAGTNGIVWALEAMARRPDRTGLLKSLRVPVLVLHGEEDQLIRPHRARELATLPADCQYVGVPRAAHGTPVEAPAAVASALTDLVRRAFELQP